ncbi:hypothetical protein LMG6871_02869 [Ralstonia edaphis]|uniref:hypothetical protein n=1 Tax=Ralstonia edaphi TaxID=3058599 RepID=UPI0028F6422D|nr:hypothetical protein [Ralstonia sp. LMG 6871]CAJ0719443.1 hypothetical protein LMG6871_02869 [Ralstonia sp. LMG 6871]
MTPQQQAAIARCCDHENLVGELVEALEAITDHLERIGDTRPHKDGRYIEDARKVIAKAKEGAQS